MDYDYAIRAVCDRRYCLAPSRLGDICELMWRLRNMIVIDHGNGYQTRYLHMQHDGLLTEFLTKNMGKW